MRGDFSSFWKKEANRNFNGVLHQQGRVLLDRDWNAQTEIVNDWQETAAADIIGAGVAAVPADAPDSFMVTSAEIAAVPDRIEITVNGGRVWADGLLVESRQAVTREATYLEPPAQTPKASLPNNFPINPPGNPAIRDAIILEAWHEELNAFQVPSLLIEPALGGVDTTERMQTAYRYRLFRMDEDDTCDSIIERLKDNFDDKGRLTVTLDEDTTTDGDCPVPKGGGYTGFEHQLYRIEIAQTKHAETYFKWSQFNGGLVGRGRFVGSGANRKVKIDANLNAIINSDLTGFYLETLQKKNGSWQVTFGAKVTLNTSDNTLSLPANSNDDFFGAPPTPGSESFFFRLWNDIRLVGDFTAETKLQDGIKLQFDAEAEGKYTPHDFWTFTVRAGEIENSDTLIDNRPPQGIYYHRVPLAELNWTSAVIDAESGDIEDCRRIFQPLTKMKGCCTYRVGDGVYSHGDFTSINEAIKHLPASGGEICVLPGVYKENVVIGGTNSKNNKNIILKGCGARSRIEFPDDDNADPVIHVIESQNIRIESLAIKAHENGVGILLEGPEATANDDDQAKEKYLKNISLEKLFVTATKQSAIEGHIGQFIDVRNCLIHINDEYTETAGIYLAGDDMLIEENEIRVLPARQIEGAKAAAGITNDPARFIPASGAAGGLQIGGGSERVRIVNNLIIGGAGNGITLGSIDEIVNNRIERRHRPIYIGTICTRFPGYIEEEVEITDTKYVAGPPLKDILVKCNRIYNMGRSGIGVASFFRQDERDEALRVGGMILVEDLTIIGNRIQYCLNTPLPEIKDKMLDFMGFGGISLAAVENLAIWENLITDNGPDYLEPVCGIFVLFAEGLEISRNHVVNNGARTNQPPTVSSIKNGARGGIVIFFGIAPQINIETNNNIQGLANFPVRFPLSKGMPAIKIHENIVSAPMGRALTLIAVGPVSVTGNNLTSLGVPPIFDVANLLCGTVFILNLGFSIEFAGIMLLKYASIFKGGTQQYEPEKKTITAQNTGIVSLLMRFLVNGNVMFSNNQCQLNLLQPENSFVFSSILIASLDDVGFNNNQCDCDLLLDIVLADVVLFGISVRASDNRLKETPRHAWLSGITLGLFLNITTDNESTHCILVWGKLYLNRYNLTMVDIFGAFFNTPRDTGDVTSLESICRGAFR